MIHAASTRAFRAFVVAMLCLLLAGGLSAQGEPIIASGSPPADGFVTNIGRTHLNSATLVVYGRVVHDFKRAGNGWTGECTVEGMLWGQTRLQTLDFVFADSKVFERIEERAALIFDVGEGGALHLRAIPQPLRNEVETQALAEYFALERSRAGLSTRLKSFRETVIKHIEAGGAQAGFAIAELNASMGFAPDFYRHEDYKRFEDAMEILNRGQQARLKLALQSMVTLTLKPNAQVDAMRAETDADRWEALDRLSEYFQSYPDAFARKDAIRCDLILDPTDQRAAQDLTALRLRIIQVVEQRERDAEIASGKKGADSSAGNSRLVTSSGTGQADLDNIFRPKREADED